MYCIAMSKQKSYSPGFVLRFFLWPISSSWISSNIILTTTTGLSVHLKMFYFLHSVYCTVSKNAHAGLLKVLKDDNALQCSNQPTVPWGLLETDRNLEIILLLKSYWGLNTSTLTAMFFLGKAVLSFCNSKQPWLWLPLLPTNTLTDKDGTERMNKFL